MSANEMIEDNQVASGSLKMEEPEVITIGGRDKNDSSRLCINSVSSSSQLQINSSLKRGESRNRRSKYLDGLDDALWSEEDGLEDYLDDEPESKSRTSSQYKRYPTDFHMVGAVHHIPETETDDPPKDSHNNEDFSNHPPDSPTEVKMDEWQDVLDYGFLEDIELVPSDDELLKEEYTIRIDDWRKMFFKVFATKIRRNKLILRTTLPKMRKSSRLKYIFVNGGSKLRDVQYDLEMCHRATDLCFNFQRYSYIICSEVSSGPKTEKMIYKGTEYSFTVGRFSAINPLSLWDFNAFWSNKNDFQVASDTSPYLSMMASQWKAALEADRVGRYIMMYQPEAVNFLKSQGETACARAEDLKEIHSTSRLLKLVLSEYIYRKKSSLLNGSYIKGREIIKSLSTVKKNSELFSREAAFRQELDTYDFVLNPCDEKVWLDQLSEGASVISPFGERLMRRTIFLCDPIHWTWCLQVLLEQKVKAMKQFMAGTTELTREIGTTQTTSQITYTREQVKQEVKDIKKLISPLPSLRSLDDYIFVNGRNFIKDANAQTKRKSFDLGLVNISGMITTERKLQHSRMSLASRLDSRVNNPFAQSSFLSKRPRALSSYRSKWRSSSNHA